ncbi:hypothetical protein, partial [Demequina sp.]|uniref:hypothetical protein n=1 Tax=Demequina sp. TaxID=2050685 RepID=UPI0025BCD9B0
MKAVAVVALSFLFAGVGATAATADESTGNVDNPNDAPYWEAQNPGYVCHKIEPPDEQNDYGALSDAQTVKLYSDQALLVVKGANNEDGGNYVKEDPLAGVGYQAPPQLHENPNGDFYTQPDISHWIVCEYPVDDTPVLPVALTATDLCG